MALNWDDLRIFLAVAREGNLSAAARALRVTQPTVGRRLKTVEERLSTRLFDRLPNGFAPTASGAALLPLAEEMERAAEAVERRQASLADAVSGTVRVSAVETMMQFITAHLAALQVKLPEIELELVVTHTDVNLSKREADLMVRECLPDNPGLISHKLGAFAYAVYGERDFVERHPAARTHRRYDDCPWVGYDEEHAYFLNQTWLLKQRDGAPPSVRVNNGLVLHDAVRRGVGLGVLPCFAGDGDAALFRLTPPIHDMVSTQNLIVHRDLHRVPSVRAVMDELVALFAAEAPRLLGRDDGVRESA